MSYCFTKSLKRGYGVPSAGRGSEAQARPRPRERGGAALEGRVDAHGLVNLLARRPCDLRLGPGCLRRVSTHRHFGIDFGRGTNPGYRDRGLRSRNPSHRPIFFLWACPPVIGRSWEWISHSTSARRLASRECAQEATMLAVVLSQELQLIRSALAYQVSPRCAPSTRPQTR